MRPQGILVLVSILFLGSGCALFQSSDSFSDSSGSVSDSVGSSSDSSSASSGGGDQAYRAAVRDYAAVAIDRGVDSDVLRRGVGEVALAHGVSDWEALDGTWLALGEALSSRTLSPNAAEQYRLALARPGSRADRLMVESAAPAKAAD